ncbi:hypothetical protein CPB85DRAFT_1272536 [Mucidula mucida]|nr:hypothetical protein CPB85DRAFT_1272536 [Mucidula mucida]
MTFFCHVILANQFHTLTCVFLMLKFGSRLVRCRLPLAPSRVTPRAALPALRSSRRWATSTTPYSTATDPAQTELNRCIELGTQKLEEGDLEGAKALYQRGAEVKRDASILFNLGVTLYHLKQFDQAIAIWKESIELQPVSPDTHTNLASAYVVCAEPRPELALHHLRIAATLAPGDPEIAFNLAVMFEATGYLEEALEEYKRSKDGGVERAAMHIRNVSAKILGQRMQAAEKSDKKSEEA